MVCLYYSGFWKVVKCCLGKMVCLWVYLCVNMCARVKAKGITLVKEADKIVKNNMK